MMAGLTLPVLLLTAGYGVNVAQISITRANLLSALDSAVTSTARDLTTGAITEKDAPAVVEAFLIANGLRAYATEGRLKLDSLVINKVDKTVGAKASVVLDVAFPLFGLDNRQIITAESAAVYSDKKVEVAMMLDVTLSMRGTKLDELKVAASNAVTHLLSANSNGGSRVRVALVPYSAAVNVGPLASRSVFYEQHGGPDLPPANWVQMASLSDNCATERKMPDGSADISDLGPYNTRRNHMGEHYPTLVNRDERLGSGLATCPSARIVPLTADQNALLASIRNFSASGVTAGGIAAQWGYYMLSPNWRRPIADAGLGAGPADHNPREVSKVAILMTDGAFNTAFLSNIANPVMNAQAQSSANAEKICKEMKDDGIAVYTIGFALPADEKSAARTVLKNCASPQTGSIRYFHEASNGEELDRTFAEIAMNIERLALTK